MADAATVEAGLSEINGIQNDPQFVPAHEIPGVKDKDLGQFMYWKKPENQANGEPCIEAGWVTIGSANPIEIDRQEEKGMIPLRKYGKFAYPFDRASGVDVSRERYKIILQSGGAHEFPVEQILELGWHRRPPYRGVKFPQLRGVEIHDVRCPVCRRVFLNGDLLAKHESVVHRERSTNNQLARAIADANQSGNAPVAEALKLLAEGQAATQKVLAQQGEAIQALLAERQNRK
jgi:hypothetical protein